MSARMCVPLPGRARLPDAPCATVPCGDQPLEADQMRGRRSQQITMLAFIDLEERVPTSHPLRTIKGLADEALAALSAAFDSMYANDGRPSIPPERLLKASL